MTLVREVACAATLAATFVPLPRAAAQCPGCPGGIDENEPCLVDLDVDVTNGGCDLVSPLFSPYPGGFSATFCGLSSTYDIDSDGDMVPDTDTADTDWYLISIAALQAADFDQDGAILVRSTLTSEFSGNTFLVDFNNLLCTPAFILAMGHSPAGCPASVTPAAAIVILADVSSGLAVLVEPGESDGTPILEGVECATGENDYTLFIEIADAPVPCPGCPAGVPENEACLVDLDVDITNGGCDLVSPLFTAWPGGVTATICGLSSTYDIDSDGDLVPDTDTADTDWYRIPLADLQAADTDADGAVLVRSTLTAKFSANTFVVDIEDAGGGLCSATTFLSTGHSPPDCPSAVTPAEATIFLSDVPNGVAVLVQPGQIDGTPILEGVECAIGQNDYTLIIDIFNVTLPCPGCPAGLPENEACLVNLDEDVTNGGCDLATPIFTTYPGGASAELCGISSTYAIDSDGDMIADTDLADTDWYHVPLVDLQAADGDADGVVQVRSTLTSQFSGNTFVVNIDDSGQGLCSTMTTLASGHSPTGCVAAVEPAKATIFLADVPNGVAVLVAPGNADGSPILQGLECGTDENEYTLLIEVFDAPVVCGSIKGQGDCTIPTPGIAGCHDELCCKMICAQDPICCDVEWDDICAANAGATCFNTFLRGCDDDPDGLLPPVVAQQPLDVSFNSADSSDEEFVFTVADSIDPDQLPVAGLIGSVRWWGVSFHYDDELGFFVGGCDDDDDATTPFDIRFYEDNGVPDDFLFGTEVDARIGVVPQVFDTGIPFALNTITEFTVTLNPPVDGTEGSIAWISILRQTGESWIDDVKGDVDPCIFLWINNPSGLYGSEARQIAGRPEERDYDFTFCLGGADPCPWDCADPPDGTVATADLLMLLSEWGGPGVCDFDGNGTISTGDLLELLSNWGNCP